MYPPREAIQIYIMKNARPDSIKRASQYTATLIKENAAMAVFTCEGSNGEKYRQTIHFDDKRPNSTHCTCPYDYAGICKHTVAALRQLSLISEVTSRQIKSMIAPLSADTKSNKTGSVQKKIATNTLTLVYPLKENGQLDLNILTEDFNQHGIYNRYHDSRCTVIHHAPGEWQWETQDWSSRTRQTLRKNMETNSAVLSCSCKKKQHIRYCGHLRRVIQFIKDYLGEDCLQESYQEQRMTELLHRYGMTINDNYQEYFEFRFGEEGLEMHNKIPDLLPAEYRLPRFLPEQKQDDGKKYKEQGLALVVNFDEDNDYYPHIMLFIANCNRHGDPVSAFCEIDIYNSDEYIHDRKLEKTARIISNSIQRMARHHEKGIRQGKIEQLALLAEQFNTLLAQYPELPLFVRTGSGYRASYTRKTLTRVTISDEYASLEYHLRNEALVYRLEGYIKLGQKTYPPQALKNTVTPFFIYHDGIIFRYPDAQTAFDTLHCIAQPGMAVIRQHSTQLQDNLLAPLTEHYDIKSADIVEQEDSGSDGSPPEFARQVYVSEEEGHILFRPAAQYADRLVPINSRAQRLSLGEDGRFYRKPRNEAAEQAFLRDFESLHPDFYQHHGSAYRLDPEQLTENFWFIDFAARLKDMGVALLGTQELKSFRYNLHKPMLNVHLESGIDWFDVNMEISYGEQVVGLKELQKAFLKKQNYIELNDGTIGMLPEEWIARFTPYFKAGEIKKNHLRISSFQFGIIDELYESLENRPEFLVDLYQRKQRLQHLSAQPDIKIAAGLNATLRPYQQHGLNWLVFLHENRIGGCLADDMGLGKTLQTIAFLHYLKTTQHPDRPSLIVAPTSLVFNWQAEVKKFCPGLRLLDYTGSSRQQHLGDFAAYDIVLTTYGTLTQDIDTLKEYDFNYIVLDESQAIKNPQSQRYKAVRLLRAYNRLILSGTPIENNTLDLYSQFNFLNPGLLGSNTHFKQEFSNAIDKNKDADAANLLARIINPFILRRTKEQVATELPAKTESVIYCEMDKAQRKIYETVKKEYRDYLFSKISEHGINKSQVYILEGLTRLRQICNSPALLDDADYGDESVKLDTLMENIKEKTGNHKILVFSSFVKMLALVEKRLQAENITYEYLDGRTRNRQERVESFQMNADIRVFLISTKAGGTGLNLTEADYVFIIDPWWNPAVENQAIDRSHRIGQNKHVMAYRMICRDTIEEKILALQQRKQGIANSIISVDDEKKSFDLNEVKNLFA